MRVFGNGGEIASVEDWRLKGGPKRDHQWAEGRSACELAKAWCRDGQVAIPAEIRALLDSCEATRGLVVEEARAECRIPFDENGGEPRNADLAFVGVAPSGPVAVTIEAKADEPFGQTIGETMAAALERLTENSRSRGVRRIEELVRAVLPPRAAGAAAVTELRYQLLTAVAGSIAFAAGAGRGGGAPAQVAVMIVHEFETRETRAERLQRNDADFRAFLGRLGVAGREGTEAALYGPIAVPGESLWDAPARLYVGKVRTRC